MLSGRQFVGLAQQLGTQGGFTVDPRTGSQPSSGVSVAIPGREVITEGTRARTLVNYAASNADALAHSGAHLGGWRNPDNGKDYLDVSHVIPEHPRGHHIADVHHAMHVNQQIASFDLGSANTIQNPRFPDYASAGQPDEFGSTVQLKRKS